MDAIILSIHLKRCQHLDIDVKKVDRYKSDTSMLEIFQREHGHFLNFDVKVSCPTLGLIANDLTVKEIQSQGIKQIIMSCVEQHVCDEQHVASVDEMQKVDAFELIMKGGVGALPSKKTSSRGGKLNEKDKIFNTLIDKFAKKSLDWPKATAEKSGSYFLQTLQNAAWYITNHHDVLNDAAKHRKELKPVPPFFADPDLICKNDAKHKKMKQPGLSSELLKTHSSNIFSILQSGDCDRSQNWTEMKNEISEYAECLKLYAQYLNDQTKKVAANHALMRPVRSIAEDATVEHRFARNYIFSQYNKLDAAIKQAGEGIPVTFDEKLHTTDGFSDKMSRFRFFSDLQLSVPVDMIKFCPGGSIHTTVVITQVKKERSTEQMMTEGATLLQKLKPNLKEYHTRSMKKAFREKIANITHLSPAIANFIYSQLTEDASTPANKVMQQRLHLISLGATHLAVDLRSLNKGRPTSFDTFFEKLELVIESVTAADERRHGVSHLSEFISLKDLVNRAAAMCDPDTAIPSKELVRLQFTPRNKYAHTARNFTSRFPVQYKIQVRQLRASHEDDHFCNAQLLYFKKRAIQEGNNAQVFFMDDKAKVPIGEPGLAVSTGVRGKKTLFPLTSTPNAADHDINKSSLTPSVYLKANVPDDPHKSFVRGSVHVAINDSVFQQSGPFRHAATICEIATTQPILMKFTDGGTDQRNNIQSVMISNIAIFKKLNLDMLVHARCAPGHSWINPAERVMSILNLGLQNCSLTRSQGTPEEEALLKKCNSMAEIRKHPELKDAWEESLRETKQTIRERFARLQLKDEPFVARDSTSEEKIAAMQTMVLEMFPGLEIEKLQKQHVSKCVPYQDWLRKHTKSSHYLFQIRKCDDVECCTAPSLSDSWPLPWLPDPVMGTSGEKYMDYEDVKTMETTDKDRPSKKAASESGVSRQKTPNRKRKAATASTSTSEDVQEEDADDDFVAIPEGHAALYTNQNARACVECVECRKPRVLYCERALSSTQKATVSRYLSEVDYTCGAPALPAECALSTKVMARGGLRCATPVETQYWALESHRADLCAHCAEPGGVKPEESLKKFKKVAPICPECLLKGLTPVQSMPYKSKK